MNTKKCVVVDLDGTLWGGIVGEDGFDGIQLSLKGAGGSFLAFQQGLRDLYDRGVILAINSRNTPEVAWKVIREHPNMLLREEHFAASRINWGDKVDNMRSLAAELRLGLDSMVFFDDDPTNRAAMRALLPQVDTPELPADASEYASLLMSLPYFPSEATTDEDKMRGNLYVTERLRMESEKEFTNRAEFLKSLKLRLSFFEDDERALERLSQLTEKTNQFNINKRPLSVDEIRAYARASTHKIFYGRLTDRFGDSGIIAFALVRTGADVWHIEQLLMSCRILSRGVEDAFLAAIAARARQSGARDLTVGFVPSEKNRPVEDFIKRMFGDTPLQVDSVESPAHIRIEPE